MSFKDHNTSNEVDLLEIIESTTSILIKAVEVIEEVSQTHGMLEGFKLDIKTKLDVLDRYRS